MANTYNIITQQLPMFSVVVLLGILIAWFLWWKGTLHKEIVEPDIKNVNRRIDFLETRTEKLEDLYDRIQENIEHKIDKMSEQIVTLTEKVAQLSGKLEAIKK